MPDDRRSPDDDRMEQELRPVMRRIRETPIAWESPPEGLWQRIADEAGVEAGGSDVTSGADGGRRRSGEHAGTVDDELERRRTGRRMQWMAAAAVIVALLVVATVAGLWSSRSDDDTIVVASTELERLDDRGAGSAELIEHDGVFQLRLATSDVAVADGEFAEVWIINPDVTELISLGPLRSDELYELPHGVDPALFPIVDVSTEPFDGDPTHSGNSLLRGTLTF